MTADSIWLLRLDPADESATAEGPRLAVKDCIDVAGTPTTAACPAIADDAPPADADAPVVATARQQGARIVGKTNLVELCRHIEGINPWTGTPSNPLDPRRVPGGSSSGSAVAVATDEADVGYGTDTGGSVRVPAACCGIAGLKTTAGRVPTHGVLEFSRTLDTVGPLAPDVAGLAIGMDLLEPGFRPADGSNIALTAARLRFDEVDPGIDAAIDEVLATAGVRATDVRVPEWGAWGRAADDIMIAEGYWAQRHLLDRGDRMEERHLRGIRQGADIAPTAVTQGRRVGVAQRTHLGALLDRHGFLVLPTLAAEPPLFENLHPGMTSLTVALNLAGLPAVALPVPRADGGFPASLQLVAPWYAEEELLAYASWIEAAIAART